MDTSLRSMIREVLTEEIGKAKAQGLLPSQGSSQTGAAPKLKVREEMISLRSDGDLSAFVARLAEILKDGRSRDEIERGRWVFRLASSASGAPAAPQSFTASPAAPPPSTARVEKGIIGEKQIESLPEGTKILAAGKTVRFTPLAKDRLRLRGITIERTS